MKTLLLLAVAKLYLIHPFHVSVCDVTYNSDDKHLKISVRVFLDDMEEGLRQFSGNEHLVMDQLDSLELNTIVKDYLISNLNFTTRKPAELHYLGFEVEDGVIWSYLEVERLRPFSEMEVQCSLLLNVFNDQENLVHIRNNGKVRSLRMMKGQTTGQVSWEN